MQEPLTLPQYSLAKIAAIWAAAALPMPVMAFWAAPWLATATGMHPGIAVWAMMIAGMVWQFVLSCLLLHAEAGPDRQGTWGERLWLQAPRDPASGRPRLALLWWVVPVVIGTFAIEQTAVGDLLAAPLLWLAPDLAMVPAPELSSLAQPQFIGAWWLIPMALISCIFNYALGEELLFRGVLLPRMQGAFGRWDWIANAALFGSYHLIRPLTIPAIVISTMLWTWPSRRYRSVWFALIPHAIEGLFLLAMVIALVAGALPV
jgi:uncharacterized protein